MSHLKKDTVSLYDSVTELNTVYLLIHQRKKKRTLGCLSFSF